MKKSEFKMLIKEAILEMLPDIVGAINESYVPNSVSSTVTEQRSSIPREMITKSSGGYDGLPDSVANKFKGPAPKLDSEIVNGEKYTSGKGVLEWFAKTSGGPTKHVEFGHTQTDMDSFMKKKFGV